MLLVILALSFSTQCVHDGEIQAGLPVVVEYVEFLRTNPNAGETVVSRRSVFELGPPLANLIVDSLSAAEQYVVGVAYRLIALFFPAHHGDKIDVTLTMSTLDVGTTLGTANYETNEVVIYTNRIPDQDSLLLVIIHELFHLFAFGPLSSPNVQSFRNRTDPVSFIYDGNPDITTDENRAHWAYPYKYDVMQSVLTFGKTTIGYDTLLAIKKSRPGWVMNGCRNSSDCIIPSRPTCQRIGDFFGSVCVAISYPAQSETAAAPTQILVVIFGLFLFFLFHTTCRRV
jgi:hypothetical protein